MKKVILLLLAVFLSAHIGVAGKIYQWKDDDGKTHFTDNLALVPAEHQDKYSRDIPDYISKDNAKLEPQDIGRELWQNRCKSCHYMGDESGETNARNLNTFLTDPSNGRAVGTQVLSMSLGAVLESHGSLITQKLSKGQVIALGGYLSDAQHTFITTSSENQ